MPSSASASGTSMITTWGRCGRMGPAPLLVGGDLLHEGATHAFEYQNARADLGPPPAPDPWLTAERESER